MDVDAWTGWRGMTRTQYLGQWFQLDTRHRQSFDKLVLDNTWAQWDSPQKYAVTVSDDGVHWSAPISVGHGQPGITTITFLRQTARCIRITQTGSNTTYHWSIYELNVYRSARCPASFFSRHVTPCVDRLTAYPTPTTWKREEFTALRNYFGLWFIVTGKRRIDRKKGGF